MNRKFSLTITSLLVILIIASIGMFSSSSQKTVVVFAGSASKPVLEEAVDTFRSETGIDVELHLGSSGTMLSQMKISKTGDLYIPGSDDYMVKAIEAGVVDAETVKVLSYLIPAIIVQEGNPKSITSLEDLTRSGVTIGIGDPQSVCIGEYAFSILEYNNIADEVDANIIVYAESCSKLASLITTGSVDTVIGWRVFTDWNPEKTDVITIKPEGIPKIAGIVGAVSTYSQNREDAIEFLNFLSSQEGQEIFVKYGYIAILEDARIYAPIAKVPDF